MVHPTVVALVAAALAPAAAQTYRGLIGAEVEIGEGNRSRAFADLAKTFRPPETPVDADGWPATDAEILFFDNRPYAAWNPAIGIDDPEDYRPDWSGDYHLSFQGRADVTSTGDPVTIRDVVYDGATNTTTATVSVSRATALLVLRFGNTQRAPLSGSNTGITGLKLLRPGYGAGQVFTDDFLKLLQPYGYLRFMGVLDTNGADPVYDPARTLAQNQIPWANRRLPTDATQQSYGNKHGLAWEYVIQIANLSGKDLWINVPVSASDDYVAQLARLMHDTLKPGIRIYIEHGNEVWNPIFTAYVWNKAAADAEVAAGNTKLDANDPPLPGPNDWPSRGDEIAQRRHARRLAEIARIFLTVYGEDAFGRIVRPIYAGWTILPTQYGRVLWWLRKNVGEPNTLFYGIAQTHYYNDHQVVGSARSAQDVLNAFRADSDAGVTYTDAIHAAANQYGLKQVIYEAGADILRNVAGDLPSAQVPGLTYSIAACRDAQMKDIVVHDVKDNWFAHGGAEYTYFTMSGGVSRWGCWGAVEDVAGAKADSPKLQGIQQLVGGPYPAPVIEENGIVNAATYKAPIAPGAFASIFGQNFADQSYDWTAGVAGGRLPAVVGAVMVRINGQDCVVSYAGPMQINFLVPPDTVAGPATVEVTAPGGKVSAGVEVAAYSPGFFLKALNDQQLVAALIANTGIYVAPEGVWPGVTSRPARPGDWLELYATGLGISGAPYGTVLTQPYPIDASQITVTIDGLPATVSWAGMTYAGLFQINVQVPALARAGFLPVLLEIAGRQTGGVLPFALP